MVADPKILCFLALAVRMFANGPGYLGSIPGRVIPKTQKWYLMPPCLILSIIRYRSEIKWSNPGKGVAPSSTPWCSSYRKGSLQVTLNYGCQLYLLTYLSINVIFITLSFVILDLSMIIWFQKLHLNDGLVHFASICVTKLCPRNLHFYIAIRISYIFRWGSPHSMMAKRK